MIHHVSGFVAEKSPGRVVVDVGGLGLEMLVSTTTWNAVGSVGEPVSLLSHLAIREDAWTLFGFTRDEERVLFRLLLGVQGVGPRVALGVLSGVPAPALRRAVQGGDVSVLKAVSGVGKKLAERIIVDLRDKVGELPGAFDVVAASVSAATEGDPAVDALVALGYPRPVARDAVRGARSTEPEEGVAVETVVKEALRRI
ncbi:MAG: Holliday junction branch migration protein RuvA [Candidatus Eiseniibacteriota bacterium]